MLENISASRKVVTRIGITPVGSSKYRINRLRFHLLAYAIARKAQLNGFDGQFIIRCDDTNALIVNRSFLDAYLEVLLSLGVVANRKPHDTDNDGCTLFQSERGRLYERFVVQLMDCRLAYRHASGAVFFDPRAFSERFGHLLINLKLTVPDVTGNMMVDVRAPSRDQTDSRTFAPFALVRSNGNFLYNLASPVDDALMGVTHVVRDRDKLNLVHKQEMIRISLGFPAVQYVHAPLLVDIYGKRFVFDEYYGDATFQDFIARGILSKGLVSYLLASVSGPSEKFYQSIDEYAVDLELPKLHRANTLFDRKVLESHNKKAIERTSDDEYRSALKIFLGSEYLNLSQFLDTDPALLDLLLQLRRDLPEARKLVANLLNPKYLEIDSESASSVQKVVTFLSTISDQLSLPSYRELLLVRAEENSRDMGLTKKVYYEALRYILTGERQGCQLGALIGYFERNGSLRDRLENARQSLALNDNRQTER